MNNKYYTAIVYKLDQYHPIVNKILDNPTKPDCQVFYSKFEWLLFNCLVSRILFLAA